MSKLEGRAAVVTGAAMGLGEAIARAYAREGARVVVADIDEEAGHGVAAAIEADGGESVFVRTDVRSEDAVAGAIAAATSRWGRLDIMVNNAGIVSKRDELQSLDTELWDDILATDLRSVYFGMKHAIPAMIDGGGGAIISMTSIAALYGYPTGLAYGAAKAGIVKMTITLAARYGKHGIRANAIAPGMMRTPLSDRFLDDMSDEEKEALFAGSQPVPRSGKPEDVANAAVFLASDDANFITGQTLVVDGGLVMAGRGAARDV